MKNMRKRSVLIKNKQTVLVVFEGWNCEDFSFFQAFAMKEKSEAFPAEFRAFSENKKWNGSLDTNSTRKRGSGC